MPSKSQFQQGPDNALWKIDSIVETTEFDVQQGAIPAFQINFSLADGTPASVTIAKNEFHPEKAQAEVHQLAMQMMHVLSMHGPSPDEMMHDIASHEFDVPDIG